jgi:cyclopropane fatty-acyl-phospholipid synthase-like methyltransferase
VVVALLAGAALLAWLERERLVARVYLLTLESDARVRRLQIDRVVQALGLVPGQTVADIGAGTGVFSRALARAVGEEGTVYAVDVNAELLAHVARTAAAAGLRNLRTAQASEDDPRLPQPVDLVFLCDTFHHIPRRADYVRTLRRYLRPGGRIAVIDPPEDSRHLGALLVPSMRYRMTDLERWMAEAGFEPAVRHDFLDGFFFVVYACPSCPDPAG